MMRVNIIGDSSSSGIGMGRACYPFQLSNDVLTGVSHCIENLGVPGMTSRACLNLVQSKWMRHADIAVIYIGNNEAAGHGTESGVPGEPHLYQGSYSFRPILARKKFSFQDREQWKGAAISPSEFHRNLESIVEKIGSEGTEVILINPIANSHFPAGLALNNCHYFAYCDLLGACDDIVADLQADDRSVRTIVEAHRKYAAGRRLEACGLLASVVDPRPTVRLIVGHNLACYESAQDVRKGIQQLQMLIDHAGIYSPILFWNLSVLCEFSGLRHLASVYRDSAYREDLSSYRIQPAYRDAVTMVAEQREIVCLDLATILNEADFVDYCHPTVGGHLKIAKALGEVILDRVPDVGVAGRRSYHAVFPSPGLGRQGTGSLASYYGAEYPISSTVIRDCLSNVLSGNVTELVAPTPEQPTACLVNFCLSNEAHPAFAPELDLMNNWLPLPHEILTFPEAFLNRLSCCYLEEFQDMKDTNSVLRKLCMDRLPSVAEYRSLTPSISGAFPIPKLQLDLSYLSAILRRIEERFILSDVAYCQIGRRFSTTLTWYTRESFRYGTQSSRDMLFDRLEIDRIIESCMIGSVIAHRLGMHKAVIRIEMIAHAIEELLELHKSYVGLFLDDRNAFDLASYSSRLSCLRESISKLLSEST